MKNKQRCLLTGATGGIGMAIAKLLAKNGYSLLLQGRNKDKLQQLQQQLPGEHCMIAGDLMDTHQRTDILDAAFSGGPVDMLINNAGVSEFGHFKSMSESEIDALMNINLILPIHLTQAFIRRLGEAPAVIVNVGSALGSIGFPCFSTYCASKFGLKGFTESLSRELAGSPVRVCYFAPRATDTGILPDDVNQMNEQLGSRVDSPEAVAEQLLQLIKSTKKRAAVGWPEKLFARINGAFPELVDKSMAKDLATIQSYANNQHCINEVIEEH